MKNIRIVKERKVITYTDLWTTAEFLLKQGLEQEVGYYCMFLSSLMFRAFSLEAFLNHIGEHLFLTWGELEKSLSPNAKLSLIGEKLNLKIEYGKAPWQIVPELIGFRNKVAHGKNSLLKTEQIVPANEKYEKIMYKFLMADWQEHATKSNSLKAKKQLEVLFNKIHAAAKIENDILFDFGAQTRSARAEH